MDIKQKQMGQSLLKDGPVTLLYFVKDNNLLRVLYGDNLSAQATHQAGSMQNEPATAFVLESAITTIENELMQLTIKNNYKWHADWKLLHN